MYDIETASACECLRAHPDLLELRPEGGWPQGSTRVTTTVLSSRYHGRPEMLQRATQSRRNGIALGSQGGSRGYFSIMGRFVTRLRPGDTELQDQIWAEAHRLYEANAPDGSSQQSHRNSRREPSAFKNWTKKNTKGLNRTPEGQAVMGLVEMASTERDASHRTACDSLWADIRLRRSP